MATMQLGSKWCISFSLFMDKNLRIILTLKRLRADLLKFKAMLLFAAKYLDQSTGQDIQLERKSKWNVSRARSQRYRAAEPLTISRLMHCNASRWWLCQYYGSGRLRSDTQKQQQNIHSSQLYQLHVYANTRILHKKLSKCNADCNEKVSYLSASNISLLHDPIYLFISQPFKNRKKRKFLGVLLGIEIMITNMTMFSRFGTRNNYKNSWNIKAIWKLLKMNPCL